MSSPASVIYQHIVDSIPHFFPGAEGVVLHRLDESEQTLFPVAVTGNTAPKKNILKIELGKGAAGIALAIGTIVKVSDILIDPRIIPPASGVKIRSLLVTPLISDKRSFGTLSIQSSQPDAFSDEDAMLLETLALQMVKELEESII